MTRKVVIAIGLFALTPILLPVSALRAQAQYGTEKEAQAMLERAVVALKADKQKAPDTFKVAGQNCGVGCYKQ